MINYRITECPVFDVVGKKIWISGQDNELFGCFWEQCQTEGLFELFEQINGSKSGPQTKGVTFGISRVENDPLKREFYYMIAIEKPENYKITELECFRVPASTWAIFECWGKVPESIVASEIYAFTDWLPGSRFVHANAPEMEVYPAGSNNEGYYCEFWLPITEKPDKGG